MVCVWGGGGRESVETVGAVLLHMGMRRQSRRVCDSAGVCDCAWNRPESCLIYWSCTEVRCQRDVMLVC